MSSYFKNGKMPHSSGHAAHGEVRVKHQLEKAGMEVILLIKRVGLEHT